MNGGATLLARGEGGEGLGASLASLWHALAWLPPPDVRVVIQVPRDTPLAVETARSLAAFLRTRSGAAVEVAEGDRPSPATMRIAGVTPPRELVVPALWFEPHVLVTVAAVGPSTAGRLAAVLEAQAVPLVRLGNPHATGDLIYEAHRLAASDLAIACGREDGDDPASPAWWLVGTSDLAVEQAVASAAGLVPTALPWLRSIGRHELVPPVPTLHGSLPPLCNHVTSGWRGRLDALRARLRASRATVRRDTRMIRRNLHKIPSFVRRRLAQLGYAGGAT